MKAVFSLLKEKPEQEAFLLSVMVDKLGDPERKIASSVSLPSPSPLPLLPFSACEKV